MRLRPHRTVDDKIDGAVIILWMFPSGIVNVSKRHQVAQGLREGEARQRLLLDDLTHRVRKILAAKRWIVGHTLRADQTNKEPIERFEGRLSALANAH